MKRSINHIHFIGIGGIGMSGIAEVLLNQGYQVSGSDISESANTKRLSSMGGDIHIGHSSGNIGDVDVVVTSSAIDESNEELVQARQKGVTVIPRAEMLSELMRTKHGIAVSGTHGKTTATSMIANMLDVAGENPTYVIGGRLLSNDRNAQLGSGDYFVAEADESDGSFLLFHPVISVVTNIDNDHLGTYQDDMDNLLHSFEMFMTDVPFYGVSILCADDENAASIAGNIHRKVLTYGFSDGADVRGRQFTQDRTGLKVIIESDKYGLSRELNLPLYGRHNALNAMACVCVGLELGISETVIFDSLSRFEGIARRFNVFSQTMTGSRNITIVDDYGHHPTEINSVIDAISDVFQGDRLVFVMEPHRYSRVKSLFDSFVESLSRADYQLLLPVYAASEHELTGATSADLCASLRSLGVENAHTISSTDSVIEVLERIVQDGDVVLFMGAGAIGSLARQFIDYCGDFSDDS